MPPGSPAFIQGNRREDEKWADQDYNADSSDSDSDSDSEASTSDSGSLGSQDESGRSVNEDESDNDEDGANQNQSRAYEIDELEVEHLIEDSRAQGEAADPESENDEDDHEEPTRKRRRFRTRNVTNYFPELDEIQYEDEEQELVLSDTMSIGKRTGQNAGKNAGKKIDSLAIKLADAEFLLGLGHIVAFDYVETLKGLHDGAVVLQATRKRKRASEHEAPLEMNLESAIEEAVCEIRLHLSGSLTHFEEDHPEDLRVIENLKLLCNPLCRDKESDKLLIETMKDMDYLVLTRALEVD